jgi:phenylacetate 2-hydroxylase
VSRFRSTNKNFQDYVPLLRYLPANGRTALAASVREQRDEWLDSLFDTVKEAVEKGTAKDCVTEKLLNNSGKTKLTLDDMKSINVSLVSGGYETLATTATATIGFLATEEGQRVQERAFADLMKVYGSSVERLGNRRSQRRSATTS